MDGNESKKLGDKIVEFTKTHWEANRRPLLLSALGPMLTRTGFSFREIISPLKLSQFIKFSLDERVDIVEDANTPEKIGIIPFGESYSFEKTSGLQAGRSTYGSSGSTRRIKPSLWAAFVKPIDAGSRRLLDLSDGAFHFRDVGAEEVLRSGEVEINSANVVDGGAPEYDPSKIISNIHEFCKEKSVDVENIYISKSEKEKKGFFDFFEGLSEDDLRKVQIPFEVIYRIVKR